MHLILKGMLQRAVCNASRAARIVPFGSGLFPPVASLLGTNNLPVTPQKSIAVGTLIAERPPHRTVRAEFPHTAPTLGV